MYNGLKEYIRFLEAKGELRRIPEFTDPVLEIACATDIESKKPGGGKALLFENTGTAFPVLTNMMGSEARIRYALGVDALEAVGPQIDALLAQVLAPKKGLRDKLRMLPLLNRAAAWMPRIRKGPAPCQESVQYAAQLSQLPVLQCWPQDGGRFITLPLVHTVSPVTGIRNVGMYRMQVLDDATTGMHWHPHKTGAKHLSESTHRLPVAVCLGGDPVYSYAATAPLPEGIDEYLLAGFLRGKPVELVKCFTQELLVPADCDFVIEGYVQKSEDPFMEGPFGDHTGFFSLTDRYPLFHVTAITHRRDAVYPATVVGIPPQEDAWIALATEKIFLAPIRMAVQPEVEDLTMPTAGTAHNIAVVSIDKRYDGQAVKVAQSLWGAGQMMFNKYLLLTRAGTDIRDTETLAALLRGADVGRCIIRSEGILDILDHATATCGFGGKAAFDLTETEPTAEADTAAVPTPTDGIAGVADDYAATVAKWGAAFVFADEDADIHAYAKRVSGAKYIIFLDTRAKGLENSELLWLAAANTDPRRDLSLCGGVLIADARSKRPGREGNPGRFPNVVVSSAATVALVDRRWQEYGCGEFIASPSERYRRLLLSESEQWQTED